MRYFSQLHRSSVREWFPVFSRPRPSIPGFVLGLIGTIIVFGFIGPLFKLIMMLCFFERMPLYYKQARIGQDGRVFTFWKFRTMRPGVDKHEPMVLGSGTSRTRFGDFLSTWMFDELPQVLNLMRGDIRFFGPRAMFVNAVKILESKIENYDARVAVAQGFVSLGHAIYRPHGSPQTEAEWIENHRKILRIDEFYIAHQSIALNMVILRRLAELYLDLTKAKLADRRTMKASAEAVFEASEASLDQIGQVPDPDGLTA